MLKKKILFIFIILVFLICSTCYAASVPITKENLSQSFQDVISSGVISTDEEYNIIGAEVQDNTIIINTNSGPINIKYSLEDKPTFSCEIQVQNGMTYEEFEAEQNKLSGTMYSYLAVAEMNNIDIGKALMYFTMSLLSGGEGSFDISGSTSATKDEIEQDIMGYVNSQYGEKKVISDNGEGMANTFTLEMEQQDVTDTSCKIVWTLTINEDGNFEAINMMGEGGGETPGGEQETPQEENQNQEPITNEEKTPINTSNQNSGSGNDVKELPKTGKYNIMYILIVAIIFSILFGIGYRKLKDVK